MNRRAFLAGLLSTVAAPAGLRANPLQKAFEEMLNAGAFANFPGGPPGDDLIEPLRWRWLATLDPMPLHPEACVARIIRLSPDEPERGCVVFHEFMRITWSQLQDPDTWSPSCPTR